MNIPRVGTRVSVRVKNNSALLTNKSWAPNTPESYVYVGKIIKGPDWLSRLNTPSFCITLDDEPYPQRNPYRIVAMCNVLEIDGTANSIEDVDVAEFEIAGSKGQVYSVIIRDTNAICTCPGYQFHHKCRHQQMALNKLVENELKRKSR